MRVIFERDALGRVTSRRIERQGSTLAKTRLSYHGDRLVRVEGSTSSRTFTHDERGRLVGIQSRSDATQRHPLVDARRDLDGGVLELAGTSYEYDRSGRRTKKIGLDGEVTRYRYSGSRLVEVELAGGRIRYAYDALGRMIRRTHERDGKEHARDFVWDGVTLLHEREGDELTSYVHVDGELVLKLVGDRRFSVLSHSYGSPSELFDESGTIAWQGDLDIRGMSETRIEETAQPFRFSGHWEDRDAGLALSFSRAYDLQSGVYLTPQSIARGPDLYAYVADAFSSTSPLGFGPARAPFWGNDVPLDLNGELESLALESLALESLDSPPLEECVGDPWRCALGRLAQYALATRGRHSFLGPRNGVNRAERRG